MSGQGIMSLSPKEAATLVGMTKQGIIRAIHTGKLSATRNEAGRFEIDRSELFRVYPPLPIEPRASVPVDDNSLVYQVKSLQDKVNMLERMLADKDNTLQKVFERLAAQQQVTLMLEDKQSKSLWARLFGGWKHV
jgi:hypothetical protein